MMKEKTNMLMYAKKEFNHFMEVQNLYLYGIAYHETSMYLGDVGVLQTIVISYDKNMAIKELEAFQRERGSSISIILCEPLKNRKQITRFVQSYKTNILYGIIDQVKEIKYTNNHLLMISNLCGIKKTDVTYIGAKPSDEMIKTMNSSEEEKEVDLESIVKEILQSQMVNPSTYFGSRWITTSTIQSNEFLDLFDLQNTDTYHLIFVNADAITIYDAKLLMTKLSQRYYLSSHRKDFFTEITEPYTFCGEVYIFDDDGYYTFDLRRPVDENQKRFPIFPYHMKRVPMK